MSQTDLNSLLENTARMLEHIANVEEGSRIPPVYPAEVLRQRAASLRASAKPASNEKTLALVFTQDDSYHQVLPKCRISVNGEPIGLINSLQLDINFGRIFPDMQVRFSPPQLPTDGRIPEIFYAYDRYRDLLKQFPFVKMDLEPLNLQPRVSVSE